jgi:hypothetical protein
MLNKIRFKERKEKGKNLKTKVNGSFFGFSFVLFKYSHIPKGLADIKKTAT